MLRRREWYYMSLKKLIISEITMKKLLLLSVFIWTIGFVYSQEVIDTSYLKCSYIKQVLRDTVARTSIPEEVYILEIGNKSSRFYSFHEAVYDSVMSDPKLSEDRVQSIQLMIEKFNVTGKIDRSGLGLRSGSSQNIYKNYPSGRMTVTEVIPSSHFIYLDSINAQNWIVIDSMKTVLGYECQKAKTHFRGRYWTVWFAPEIPVSDGPWKLMGLPGLIMEAYDKNKHYRYEISGLEYSEAPIIYKENKLFNVGTPLESPLKQQKCTRQQFLKAKWLYDTDPITYINLSTNTQPSKGYVKKERVVLYDFEEIDYK